MKHVVFQQSEPFLRVAARSTTNQQNDIVTASKVQKLPPPYPEDSGGGGVPDVPMTLWQYHLVDWHWIADATRKNGSDCWKTTRFIEHHRKYMKIAPQNGPKPISKLTNALIKIEPKLKWYRRPEAKNFSESFFNGHANAVIVGDGGFEVRHDVRIGMSLVAPNIDYPRHRHPPEELYIVLAPGSWMQNDENLTLKTPGDLIHNSPNCWHAMQSIQTPLLAIWCLWLNWWKVKSDSPVWFFYLDTIVFCENASYNSATKR